MNALFCLNLYVKLKARKVQNNYMSMWSILKYIKGRYRRNSVAGKIYRKDITPAFLNFIFGNIIILILLLQPSSLKTYQERQRDWPDEALATLTSYSLVRRCQLQLFRESAGWRDKSE